MAACFDKYWCWAAPYLPGRTASAAYELNIPFIYTEGQGGGGILPKDVKILSEGFFEFLKRFDGSNIGSRDNTTVPQCIPKIFLLFKSWPMFNASSGLVW